MPTKTQTKTEYIITGNNMGTSADTIAAAMDRILAEGKITEPEKSLVIWLFSHAREAGMGLADIGSQIGYSSTTVSRLFSGRYEGNYTDVIAKVRAYRHLSDERRRLSQSEFIETSIWHEIRKACDLALIHQIPGIIMGVPQIGKSKSLEQYRDRSEYVVRYVRMPAAPGFRGAIEAIADACSITTRCTTEQLRRRLYKGLDNRSLLIIDELHQLAISAGRNSAMKIMEYIRELMDMSGCGLIICGTRALDEDLINGELAGWLEQFRERLINQVDLPDRLPTADILLVAQSYGLASEPDADTWELLKNIRMNRLLKTLMLARNYAANHSQEFAWLHFARVHKSINPLNQRTPRRRK